MGVALIVRRGGSGGVPTKATDISDSVTTTSTSATLTIDTSKMYMVCVYDSEGSNVSVLIVNGAILCETGGSHCSYGVSNGKFFAQDDQYCDVENVTAYLLE